MTKVIGLTGGIASGKSTVSNFLKQQGYPIVDADQVARDVVAPGSNGIRQIRQAFGTEIVDPDGHLNRQRLGEIVFQSASQMARLNHIVQPLIRTSILQQIEFLKRHGATLIFLDIPLLFEQHYEGLCDEVMVVSVDAQRQRERLMRRNSYSKCEAMGRINSQMPLADKVKRADVVIDNNGDVNQTYRQVKEWLRTVSKH